MASHSSRGRTRRCNAKCYNARGSECHCACGGVNHGVGECQARQNSHALGLVWKDQSLRMPHVRRKKWTIPREQGTLFPLSAE
jgi:hypothetical protein